MVVTFGELLLRLSSPNYTRLLQNNCFETSFCGAEANVAVSLSNYGIDTEFVTVLPDNDIGASAKRELIKFGVGVNKTRLKEGRMGLYYLEKGASQRPSKVIYDRSYSAFANSANCDYDWDNVFSNATWFHFSGITPALSDSLANICLHACQTAKDKGITISCDLNYRAKLWNKEKARLVMSELMHYVDVCFANEEDAEMCLGIKANNTDIETGQINVSGYKNVSKQICFQYGCKYVAFSLRKSYSASYNGWSVMLYDSEFDNSYISKDYDIQIIDRVGSGDSFTAGIIYGMLKHINSFQYIVDFAAAASCLKHSIEGDFNRVTVDEVNRLISDGGNGRVQR